MRYGTSTVPKRYSSLHRPALAPSGTFTPSLVDAGGAGEPAGTFFGIFQPGGIQDDSPFSSGSTSATGVSYADAMGAANGNSGLTANTNAPAEKKVSGATALARQQQADMRMYLQWGLAALGIAVVGYVLIRAYRK